MPGSLRLRDRHGQPREVYFDRARRDGDWRQLDRLADRLFELEELSEQGMRAKMEAMQDQMSELFETLNDVARRVRPVKAEPQNGLIPVLRVSQFPQTPKPAAPRRGRPRSSES